MIHTSVRHNGILFDLVHNGADYYQSFIKNYIMHLDVTTSCPTYLVRIDYISVLCKSARAVGNRPLFVFPRIF